VTGGASGSEGSEGLAGVVGDELVAVRDRHTEDALELALGLGEIAAVELERPEQVPPSSTSVR
jgi:hypothetical protein